MKLALQKMNVTPTSDPQDGGFDTFLNYVCTRDPTSDEPLMPYHNYPWLPFWWQTSTTNEFFLCVDNTAEAMIWRKMLFADNIAANLPANVLTTDNLDANLPVNLSTSQLNTNRSDSPISLAVNTARRPSTTNDVEVSVDFNFTTLLSTSSTVVLQTSPDNSAWTTKKTISLDLGLASNKTLGLTKIIPMGYYYQYVVSGSGTVSVVNHFELTL